MNDLIKKLPAEILEKIFQFLSLQDLRRVVLVSRRWREVGETPALWSEITVTVNRKNQAIVTDILRSRRMEAVRKISIGGESVSLLSQEGWMSVIEHPGLRELEVLGDLSQMEVGLVSRVVTNMETLNISGTYLTREQVTTILRTICERSVSKVKLLDLGGNYNVMYRVEPGLLARAVTKLEKVDVSDINLTLEQVNAILGAVCDEPVMKLKILDISNNNSVRRVEPTLLARAVTRLEEMRARFTQLTEEQKFAIKEEKVCRISL